MIKNNHVEKLRYTTHSSTESQERPQCPLGNAPKLFAAAPFSAARIQFAIKSPFTSVVYESFKYIRGDTAGIRQLRRKFYGNVKK